MKDVKKKYPFNPAYYKAHNDICKRRDTKHLYFEPLRIDLPHGRGAGTTSFCAIEAILAIEKSVVENQKPKSPKKNLPYYTAKQQDTDKLRNVLVMCPEPGYAKSMLNYFVWALEKLNLKDAYAISASSRSLTRLGTKNVIRIVTPQQMRGMIPPLFKFSIFVIDEASCLPPNIFTAIQDWISGQQSAQNRILLVSYNPDFRNNWLQKESKAYMRAHRPNYKRYHADYRSVPKDWLWENFFKQAKMLEEANPKAYSEQYLGKPYKEPKKNVPCGTKRGKRAKTKNVR